MMTVEADEVLFADLRTSMEQTFAQIARDKGLEFAIDLGAELPQAITTDSKRLQQVLKNLLSNALKSTEQGSVTLRVEPATKGWNIEHQGLSHAEGVVAFAVSDTGIGIPADKQRIVFEAFQQADGTTSRKYGGTGLRLAISRELADLLRGEMR